MANHTNKQGSSLSPVSVSPLDYRPGDSVKKLHHHGSDVVGVVTHLMPKTFKVRVQWPSGSEVENPEEIYKVSKTQFPPTVSFDTSYDSYENRLSEDSYGIGLPKRPQTNRVANKVADQFNAKISEITDKVLACKQASMSEVKAFMELSNGDVSDDLLKSIIATVYE